MKTFNQFLEEEKNWVVGDKIKEKQILFNVKNDNANERGIVLKSKLAGKPSQDDYYMLVIDKNNKAIKSFGTHPSLDGAKKFVKKKMDEHVLEEGKLKSKREFDMMGSRDKALYVFKMADSGISSRKMANFYDFKKFEMDALINNGADIFDEISQKRNS